VGLKAHFEGLALDADLEMHMGNGAYLGLCRVEGKRVNACGLFPADSLRKHSKEDLLTGAVAAAGLSTLAGRMRGAQQVPGSLVGISAFQPGWRPRGPVAAVGDARVIIPPFAGNGMSMAFEGALMAVEELSDFSNGKSTWENALIQLNRRCQHHFRTRIRLALFLHPFLTHPAGQFLLSACIRSGVVPLGAVFSLLR
jgi:2-polyprenyl-6-methoxyphenol hydroxylase-like FAD-dependent oxidoreductase